MIGRDGRFTIEEPSTETELVVEVDKDPTDVRYVSYRYQDPRHENITRNYTIIRQADHTQVIQDEGGKYETVLAEGGSEGQLEFVKGIGPKRQARALGALGLVRSHVDAAEQQT